MSQEQETVGFKELVFREQSVKPGKQTLVEKNNIRYSTILPYYLIPYEGQVRKQETAS